MNSFESLRAADIFPVHLCWCSLRHTTVT